VTQLSPVVRSVEVDHLDPIFSFFHSEFLMPITALVFSFPIDDNALVGVLMRCTNHYDCCLL
jgi:hypothetical protein